MNNDFLQGLLAAENLEEISAIIAEDILEKVSEETALIARQCAILHWFDLPLIEALMQDNLSSQSRSKEICEEIISLPFVENLSWGMTFHDLTRKGLLKLYSLSHPALLINSAKLAASVYQEREVFGPSAAEAFFCHMVAGESKVAVELLDNLLEEAVLYEDWSYIDGLMQLQQEAEQLAFVSPLPLTEKYWALRGISHKVQGELEGAINDYLNVIAINPANKVAYMILAAIYTEQRHYEQALAMYDYVLELDPALIQSYINRGIIYFRQNRHEEAAKNLSRAIRIDSTNTEAYAYYIQALIGFFRDIANSGKPLDQFNFKHSYTEEATKNLSRAIQIDPTNAEAYAYYIQALVGFFHAAVNADNPLEQYAFKLLSAEGHSSSQQMLMNDARIAESELLEMANILDTLAALYSNQGQYRDAEPLLQQSLAIREQVLGLNHKFTAQSFNELALLHSKQGNYTQAELLHQRALAIREQILGTGHPDTAQSLNDLATLYVEQDNYKLATSFLQRALAIREQVLGPTHPYTAQSFNLLGILFQKQNNYLQAETFYQRTLVVREQVLGLEHPDTTQSLNNLAVIYYLQHKYEQAESLYQRALAIREQILGPEHPDTAQSLNNLALLYADKGNYADAELLYQRALNIFVQILGIESIDTAQILNNFAVLSEKLGKYAQAEPLYQRALNLYTKILGPEHPRVIIVRKNYDNLLLRRGDAPDSYGLRHSGGRYTARLVSES